MNKFVIALMSVLMLFIAGCASSGGGAAMVDDNGGLPELAAYDDEAYDPLPDMVALEL